MSRINLGGGRWFNPKTAQCFSEATRWNGRNHVSVPTGSEWEHEELYRTKGGSWILHSWSQWQGSRPSYEEIGPEQAKQWMIDNDEPDEVIDRLFPGALASAEI